MEVKRTGVKNDQILKAAQRRFHHYGLSKTTMNEIAEDIGMSKAALYYYYKDKEGIFNAVVQREQTHFVLETRKLLDRFIKAEWMILEYVDLRLKLLKEMLSLSKISYGSYLEIKPLINSLAIEFRKKEIAFIQDILKFGIKNKEFSQVNPMRYAEFFIDTLHGIRQGIFLTISGNEILNISPRQYSQLKEHSRLFADLFIKGITLAYDKENGGK